MKDCVAEQAERELKEAYRAHSLEQLRWNRGCDLAPSTRERELPRRGVFPCGVEFAALGRRMRRESDDETRHDQTRPWRQGKMEI